MRAAGNRRGNEEKQLEALGACEFTRTSEDVHTATRGENETLLESCAPEKRRSHQWFVGKVQKPHALALLMHLFEI